MTKVQFKPGGSLAAYTTGTISRCAGEAMRRRMIMKCHQARAKISVYIDHELDVESSRQLELHLHQCAECREALNDFQGLDAMVRVLPRIEPGPDFARQIMMRMTENAATGKAEGQSKLSLFERLCRFVEDFVELVSHVRTPSTGTLDEFGDFPPLSLGSIYFNMISVDR